MDIYAPSNLSGSINTPNRWIRHRVDQKAQNQGNICTLREAGIAIKAVEPVAEPPEEEVMPASQLEVLKAWGCTWMWDSLRLVGDT